MLAKGLKEFLDGRGMSRKGEVGKTEDTIVKDSATAFCGL